MSCERKNNQRTTNTFEKPSNKNDGSNFAASKGTDTYHLMVLIHGIKGNRKEMGYIKRSIENTYSRFIERNDSKLIVHSATCNEKNSSDGIEAGGLRFAKEINDVLRGLASDIVDDHTLEDFRSNINSDSTFKCTKIALSIIGYSMGGLYGRFAIRYINWIFPIGIGSTIANIVVVPHIFATIATPHLGMKGMSYFKVPKCLESLAGIIFGKSGNDVFRRNVSNRAGARKSPEVKNHRKKRDLLNVELIEEHKEEYEYTDIIERLSLDPNYVAPLARFSRRIAYANAFSTDIAVPTATAAFLFDDDSDDGASCDCFDTSNISIQEGCESQPTSPRRSSHLFIRDFHGKTKTTLSNINHQKENNGVEHSFVRFDTIATRKIDDFKASVKNTPSVSDMARNLDSLGWSKVFIDARPHIPAIWKRPSGQNRESRQKNFEYLMGSEVCDFEDQNQDNVPCYTSGALKRRLSGDGFDGNTLPFGHSFIVASTKDPMRERLYKSARPIVDRAIAEEIVNEMLHFDPHSQ